MVREIPLLALSGTVGVGKSAVGVEIHDILSGLSVPHACVDRDALAYSWPARGRFNETVALQNLEAVWRTFRAHGAARLVVVGVVEQRQDVSAYERAIPGARVVVCRLTASRSAREARLRSRERGAGLVWHLARTVELDAVLDAERVEHFTVDNDQRPLRAVASEVLVRAGWMAAPAAI